MGPEELYLGFYGELLRRCVRLTRDRAAGEDLVQETFLRALTHVEDLQDLSRSQCRAWLYRTANNLFIDRARRAAREAPEDAEALERLPFEDDLTQPLVMQLVDRLPDSEKALFVLRTFQDYNATELGELFGLSPSTVRSRLASARRRIKKWYLEGT